MINFLQDQYERDTLNLKNRLAQDTSTNKWKTTIEDLGTNMRKQQLSLRSANRRYDQVAAQGGSGDYGINKYTADIAGIRNKIETSKRDIPVAQLATATLQSSGNIANQTGQLFADLDALKRSRFDTGTFKGSIADYDKQRESFESQIRALNEQQARQTAFEAEQNAKNTAIRSSSDSIEKQFIDSILNAPLPEAKTTTGIDTRTPQEISMQRDNAKNATMPAQKRAEEIPAQYLAKNKLPLQNLTASNLRQANQRVAGATLGGNTNKI